LVTLGLFPFNSIVFGHSPCRFFPFPLFGRSGLTFVPFVFLTPAVILLTLPLLFLFCLLFGSSFDLLARRQAVANLSVHPPAGGDGGHDPKEKKNDATLWDNPPQEHCQYDSANKH